MNVKIRKDAVVLTDDHYDTPKTSKLIFHFEPQFYPSCEKRIRKCTVKHAAIDGKDLYILDDFFQKEEGKQLRDFSKTATFSRNSYGSPEAIKKGEMPARSMDGKERWQFFSSPPEIVKEVYQLLGTLAHELNVEVTTLPWELIDASAHGSPAIIANFVERASKESMDLGKHRDSNPENKVPFGIPVLYSQQKEFHEANFINGAPGKPWLVSVMLYATDEQFIPEYEMGTVFYKDNEEIAIRANCQNMRLVLFESHILHSIEESRIPASVKTWRVSYVYKLLFNPRKKEQSIKQLFHDWAYNLKATSLALGQDSRI